MPAQLALDAQQAGEFRDGTKAGSGDLEVHRRPSGFFRPTPRWGVRNAGMKGD